MTTPLHRVIFDAIDAHDDGDGAPWLTVADEAARSIDKDVQPVAYMLRDMYLRGEVYQGTGGLKKTPDNPAGVS